MLFYNTTLGKEMFSIMCKYQADGKSRKEAAARIAKEYSVTEQMVYRWLKHYEKYRMFVKAILTGGF